MPTVGFNATNLFAAAAQFHAQSSSSVTEETNPLMLDADGNVQCQTAGKNTTTRYENEFAYCNSSPAIGTDLATLLTKFGDVHDSKKVDSLTINFTAGEYATVSISGHNHTENAHAAGTGDGYADVSGAVPAGAGFGVPTFTGQTWGNNATAQSATITFTCTHVDREDYTGDHFVGKSITVKAELSMEWVGVPTTPEATSWVTNSKGPADSNSDFDTYSYTAERYFDLAT